MSDPSKSLDKLAKAVLTLATVHKEGFADIADGLQAIAKQIKCLGTGDAMGGVGGLEFMGMALKDATQTLADAIHTTGEDIAEEFQRQRTTNKAKK